ncbi:hypothetical protein ACP4OV_031033 [Aristida adscensionis]
MKRLLAWRLAMVLSVSLVQPPLASGDSTYYTACGGTAYYRANSTHQHNVKLVTDYLANEASFTTGSGFATLQYGDTPDVVYGLGLCRGDTPDKVTCYECLSTASEMAPTLCPSDRDATLF